MASRKKNELAQFEDNDLRKAHTNLLLEVDQSLYGDALLAIEEECVDRNKDFIISISNEEVRCMWVTVRKAIPDALQNIIIEFAKDYAAKKEGTPS